MKINTPIGSKERLAEIFQKVNKVQLNESFGQNYNSNNVLEVAFEELKTNNLTLKHSNSQVNGSESFVELICVDKGNNNVTFTFKVISNEGDQDGVYNIDNVVLYTFTFDAANEVESVEMDENGLKQFNAQHANELIDIVSKYVDVESEEPADSLYEDAIKKIDSYPFGGGSERMQTGKAYADEKPTNPAVRVKAPELDKFVKEDINGLLHYSQAARDAGAPFRTKKLAVSFQYVLIDALKDINVKILEIDDVENQMLKMNFEYNNEKYTTILDPKRFGNAAKIRDAIKKKLKIDAVSETMQTSKAYADEKPTNPNLRVKAPELEKIINEDDMNTSFGYILFKKLKEINVDLLDFIDTIGNIIFKLKYGGQSYDIPIKKENIVSVNKVIEILKNKLKIVGVTESDYGNDDIGGQEIKRFEQDVDQNYDAIIDDKSIPYVNEKKKQKILNVYDNLIKKNRSPNYSPTIAEVTAELKRMSGKKIKKTRSIPIEAEPFMENVTDFGDEVIKDSDDKIILLAARNVDKVLTQANKHVNNIELTKLILAEIGKIRNERRIASLNELMTINVNEDEKKNGEKDKAYPDPIGKKFKPKTHYPKKKRKPQTTVKLDESTDGDKFENVVFLQGDEAYEPLEILDRKGKDAALKYLIQWHYPGEHDGSQTENHGSDDRIYRKDGYIMSWNPHIGYIGLQYENELTMNEDTYEDDDISNLPIEPNGWGGKLAAEKDIVKSGDKHPVPYNTKFNLEPAVAESDDGMSLEPKSDEIEQLAQDKEETGEMLQGGKGDEKSPLEFDPDQVLKGMEVEMEHSDNPMIALEIVLDHLSEDSGYYTVKDTPEASAQAGASKDANKGGEDSEDKEMEDILLGFKPHNVGDEMENDEETEESPEHETGETPEEEKIEEPAKKEDELGESEQGSEKFSTVETKKYGMTYLLAYPDEQGVETREGLDNWESQDRANKQLQFVKSREEAENNLKFFGESKESELKQRDPATWHQIQIAKKTIRMPNAMAGVMGGMSKEEAKQILTQRGIKFEEN